VHSAYPLAFDHNYKVVTEQVHSFGCAITSFFCHKHHSLTQEDARRKRKEREKKTQKRREIEENYFTHKVKTICHHFCYKPANSAHALSLSLPISLSPYLPNFLSFYTCFHSLSH